MRKKKWRLRRFDELCAPLQIIGAGIGLGITLVSIWIGYIGLWAVLT